MSSTILALDVGEKRIGVAQGDETMRIAFPYDTIQTGEVDAVAAVAELVIANDAKTLVVGYPRNQSGEPTAQTRYVEEFVAKLTDLPAEVVFQDESLTSVLAEQRLKQQKAPYSKGDVDAMAACIILEDYLGVEGA